MNIEIIELCNDLPSTNVMDGMDNTSLLQVTGKLLINSGKSIAIAEACTGGLVTSMLTNIDGISRILNRSLVSCKDELKIEYLSIPRTKLDRFGTVSIEIAEDMALGIKRVSGTDIGISTTGMAKPVEGNESILTGKAFVFVTDGNNKLFKEIDLKGNKEEIRNLTSMHAINLIRLLLN